MDFGTIAGIVLILALIAYFVTGAIAKKANDEEEAAKYRKISKTLIYITGGVAVVLGIIFVPPAIPEVVRLFESF